MRLKRYASLIRPKCDSANSSRTEPKKYCYVFSGPSALWIYTHQTGGGFFVIMFGQRRRRWANIIKTLAQRIVLAGQCMIVYYSYPIISHQKRWFNMFNMFNVGSMLSHRLRCWANVNATYDPSCSPRRFHVYGLIYILLGELRATKLV